MGQFILKYKAVREKKTNPQVGERPSIGRKGHAKTRNKIACEVPHCGRAEPLAIVNAPQEDRTCCASYY